VCAGGGCGGAWRRRRRWGGSRRRVLNLLVPPMYVQPVYRIARVAGLGLSRGHARVSRWSTGRALLTVFFPDISWGLRCVVAWYTHTSASVRDALAHGQSSPCATYCLPSPPRGGSLLCRVRTPALTHISAPHGHARRRCYGSHPRIHSSGKPASLCRTSHGGHV